jgi:pimeloyl-ACP methyl ester carboxylesterase
MALAEPTTEAPPKSLERLAERFDRSCLAPVKDGARVRLEVEDRGAWDAVIRPRSVRLEPAEDYEEPDAWLTADAATWRRIDTEIRAAMNAFSAGRLSARGNLHLGVGFLAATSASEDPGRLRFRSIDTKAGKIAVAEAGTGAPIVCLHGLGATKGSFLPSLSELAGDEFRVIAMDLPGFGDSTKPIGAAYDAPYFADVVADTLDALGIERAHIMGNSMGGRVALEMGMRHPNRTEKLILLAPAMAWLKGRPWAGALRLVRPELGLIQPAPRRVVENLVRRLVPGADEGWTASGVDEFLRIYYRPRGRAAFYAAARNIYLDEPRGETGLWTRLESLGTDSLFVWGRRDTLVPISFSKHVRRCLPSAQHVELGCGHVPQVESPRETHRAVRKFLREQ